MRSIRRAVLLIAGLSTLVAGAAWQRAVSDAGRPPAPVAAAASLPPTCKPLPPVAVAMEAVPGNTDLWRIELRAIAAVSGVEVTLGPPEGTPGSDRVVWRGDLAAGAVERLEVRFAPPAGAGGLRAEAQVIEAGGTVLRASTQIELGEARHAARAAAPGPRLVTDPTTGRTVAEFQGEVRP
jgi:hypothetical protein